MKKQLLLLLALVACVCGANAETYTLITEVDQLSDDDEYILVSGTTPYRTPTSFATDARYYKATLTEIPTVASLDPVIEIADDVAPALFKIKKGSTSSLYTLQEAATDKYIKYGSTSEFNMSATNSYGRGEEFDISSTDAGNNTFKFRFSQRTTYAPDIQYCETTIRKYKFCRN